MDIVILFIILISEIFIYIKSASNLVQPTYNFTNCDDNTFKQKWTYSDDCQNSNSNPVLCKCISSGEYMYSGRALETSPTKYNFNKQFTIMGKFYIDFKYFGANFINEFIVDFFMNEIYAFGIEAWGFVIPAPSGDTPQTCQLSLMFHGLHGTPSAANLAVISAISLYPFIVTRSTWIGFEIHYMLFSTNQFTSSQGADVQPQTWIYIYNLTTYDSQQSYPGIVPVTLGFPEQIVTQETGVTGKWVLMGKHSAKAFGCVFNFLGASSSLTGTLDAENAYPIFFPVEYTPYVFCDPQCLLNPTNRGCSLPHDPAKCLFTNPCDIGCPFCDTDNVYCHVRCDQGNLTGGKQEKPHYDGRYLCGCSGKTNQCENSCETIVSSGCHPKCKSCLFKDPDLRCVELNPKDINLYVQDHPNEAPITCSHYIYAICKPGTFEDPEQSPKDMRYICSFPNCHPRCNGYCSLPDDSNYCVDCNSTFSNYYTKIANSYEDTYQCNCKPGYKVYANNHAICYSENGCSILCDGACLVPGDPTKCVGICNSVGTNIQPTYNTIASGITSCQCASGTTQLNSTSPLCIFTSGCDQRCNGKCILQGDYSKCVISCNPLGINLANEQKLDGTINCGCAPGTSSISQNSIECYFTSDCDTKCNGMCFETNNPLKCYNGCFSSPQINNLVLITDGIYSQCSCPSDTTNVPGTAICYYSNNCHPRCNGKCTIKNSDKNCFGSCNPIYENVLNQLIIDNIYDCSCISGTISYGSQNQFCVYQTPDCFIRCDGFCTQKNNVAKCIGCNNPLENNINEQINNDGTNTCNCNPGSYENPSDKSKCNVIYSGCDTRCNGKCSAINDPTQCSECNSKGINLKNILNSDGSYDCSCIGGTSQLSTFPYVCYYTSPSCGTLCNGKCISFSENTFCVIDCKGTNVVSVSNGDGTITCKCQSGFLSNPSNPAICNIISYGCHPICGSLCIEKNNPYKCFEGCNTQYPNIEKIQNSDETVTCQCKSPSILLTPDLPLCYISNECDVRCGEKCLYPNDQLSCINSCSKNVINIISKKNLDNSIGCICKTGTTQDQNHLEVCYFKNDCDPRCNGKCLEINDNSKCYKECNIDDQNLIQIHEGFYTKCFCKNYYIFDNSLNKCVLNVNCHKFCQSTCLEPNDMNSCIGGCAFLLGVIRKYPNVCQCKDGFVYNPDTISCIFQENGKTLSLPEIIGIIVSGIIILALIGLVIICGCRRIRKTNIFLIRERNLTQINLNAETRKQNRTLKLVIRKNK